MNDQPYHQGWGVIMFSEIGADTPARFDCWYTDRADAEETFRAWCKLFPSWSIAIVEGHECRGPVKNATPVHIQGNWGHA
jgi:hypothetical protein